MNLTRRNYDANIDPRRLTRFSFAPYTKKGKNGEKGSILNYIMVLLCNLKQSAIVMSNGTPY